MFEIALLFVISIGDNSSCLSPVEIR